MESEVRVNETPVAENVAPSNYVRILRTWKTGDIVTLRLPMKLAVHRWRNNRNSVSVSRGPLTYSLQIEEQIVECDPIETTAQDSQWQEDVDLKKWRAYEILPSTPWNYGLLLDRSFPENSFEIEERSWPADDYPFTAENVPVVLHGKGQEDSSMDLRSDGTLCSSAGEPALFQRARGVHITDSHGRRIAACIGVSRGSERSKPPAMEVRHALSASLSTDRFALLGT